ncbi:hypothetical protein D0862_07792 [Hortaea werneckii]|uniref:Ubiquitin-like protease family profile domain-containing protein n=1 Tax=Hortaea werneckii TaxID=91943 RepID=A0A3M7G9Z1_HORWE|nr:hypothetical protein D0862_07792 [Hortaea werneckii]
MRQEASAMDSSSMDVDSSDYIREVRRMNTTPPKVNASASKAHADSSAAKSPPSSLGKRKFQLDFDEPEFQSTPLSVVQRRAALVSRMTRSPAQSTPRRTPDRPFSLFHPAFQQEAPSYYGTIPRLGYNCVGLGYGIVSLAWSWLRGVATHAGTRIFAQQTSDRSKRRAIESTDAQNTASSELPGSFPAAADTVGKTEASQMPTPPDSRPNSPPGEQKEGAQPPTTTSEATKAEQQDETATPAGSNAAKDQTPTISAVTAVAEADKPKKPSPFIQSKLIKTARGNWSTLRLPVGEYAKEVAASTARANLPQFTENDERLKRFSDHKTDYFFFYDENMGKWRRPWTYTEAGYRKDEDRKFVRIEQPSEPKNVAHSSSGKKPVALPEDARPSFKASEADEEKRDPIDDLCRRAKAISIPTPEMIRLRDIGVTRARLHMRVERLEEEKAIAEQEAALQAEREAAEKEAAAKKLEEEKAREEEEKARKELEEAEAAKRAAAKLIVTLSPEWDERIDEAMQTRDPKKILATSVEAVELSRYDLGRLYPTGDRNADGTKPSGWLNDETVNAWFQGIVQAKKIQTGYVKGPKNTPAFEAYNSGWRTTVAKKGITGIDTWSRRKGIKGDKLYNAEKIFFPINGGGHWTLLIISPKERKVEFLDSMGGSAADAFKDAKAWLQMELKGAKQPYNEDEWEFSTVKSELQTNMSDCGAFACLNGLAAAKGRSFRDVEPTRMKEGRKMMVAVLLNGGFTGEFEL